jgi:hypothetical protein
LSASDQDSSPESWVEQLTPPVIYPIVNYTMIHVFELPCFLQKGGRVLNQFLDRLTPAKRCSGLPCMRAGGTALFCLRSFQYSRTANFRAMATFALP